MGALLLEPINDMSREEKEKIKQSTLSSLFERIHDS